MARVLELVLFIVFEQSCPLLDELLFAILSLSGVVPILASRMNRHNHIGSIFVFAGICSIRSK